MERMHSRQFLARIRLLGMHGHPTIISLYFALSIVTSLRAPRAKTSLPIQLQECLEICRPHLIQLASMEAALSPSFSQVPILHTVMPGGIQEATVCSIAKNP